MTTSINELIGQLKKENINTWFDLGLFLDRLKERPSGAGFQSDFYSFKETLVKGGIGFLTFDFAIDGTTIEVAKYASAFRQLLPSVQLHLIAGQIKPESEQILSGSFHRHAMPEIKSFNDWELFEGFFKTRLERGSEEYNRLILQFWDEVLFLTEKLATCIEENNINLLYLINICSNPGNVSLALATILISEYQGIPVINNNHDFYWEGGHREVDIEKYQLKPGPRDFFFTNAHVGEFFSTLDVVFPWKSRSWMTVNINEGQMRHVVEVNGHNPANVALLGTVVDTSDFESISKRESINTLMQIGVILNNKAHPIGDVLEHKTSFSNMPFLCGASTEENFDFVNNNILLLQPTRVIGRKRIEVVFDLLEKLLLQEEFAEQFAENPSLKVSVIVSGPIPVGQREYFFRLIRKFSALLEKTPADYRKRIFLGFLFSAFDMPEYKSAYRNPIGITDLYKAASLILLPSESEGRGLPLIEAAAAGKPVFCRRYEPEEVYAEVIGEHLEESQRLRVLEFRKSIPNAVVVSTVQRLFYPQDYVEDVEHNEQVIKTRYDIESLERSLEAVLYKLYLQLQSIAKPTLRVKEYFSDYEPYIHFTNKDLEAVINTRTREYLPGYGRLRFMMLLKSLIDPSYFRVEEQGVRGEAQIYAQDLWRTHINNDAISEEKYHYFFNAVDDIFEHHSGEKTIQHDHALTYRHRNNHYYPYQDYTFQELTGVINTIFEDVIHPHKPEIKNSPTPFFFVDWNLALVQLTTSHKLGIDNRDKLFHKLKQVAPRVYFPGQYVRYEMEFFVVQPVRTILDLGIDEEITGELLQKNISRLPKVYIFSPKSYLYNLASSASVKHYINSAVDRELYVLYKSGLVELITIPQSCIGFHLRQMGLKGLKVLRDVKKKRGFIITNGQSAAMMTDILDIDRFHIGKVKTVLTEKIMGIPMYSGFIQFVPAGVRTTLSYPTPVQTSKDFDTAMQSRQFARLAKKLGEDELYELIREDAQQHGTPISTLLDNLDASLNKESSAIAVDYSFVGSVYTDGMPWSGVLAELKIDKSTGWRFATHTANSAPRPVTELIKEYQRKSGNKAQIAWNGGYILNPELVGKLGLAETYIGSPLGFLMVDKEVKCPPLFNKPAFLIYDDGQLGIRRVSSKHGFTISHEGGSITFAGRQYNTHSATKPCFYDLLWDQETINGDGNVIVRLAGNQVKELIHTTKGQSIPVIPVGITLSIPAAQFDKKMFKINQQLKIDMLSHKQFDWSRLTYAVEAGPMLLERGKAAIDMEKEGWKTASSIKTQAARLDYTHMRGPKIAVGLSREGNLLVLAINGRIRESVGATHDDMADILISYGAETAMGFDPGGSSTLVVDGKTLNISPYNKEYEKDIYSLPPEPRFVANAVLGWQGDRKD